MADIEKVIKGLECCLRESEHIDDNPCKDCPYYDVDSGIGGRCIEEKDKDALELLKEQKTITNEIEEHQKSICGSGMHELTEYEMGKWDGLQIAWNIISEGL